MLENLSGGHSQFIKPSVSYAQLILYGTKSQFLLLVIMENNCSVL